MTPLIERAIAHILGVEGGFVDIPQDRGGKTRFGITEAVARKHGYHGKMSALPELSAIEIYRTSYWETDRLNLFRVAHWSEDVALELFDTAVNMGVGTAAKFFQRSLNLMNRNGRLFTDLKVDGHCGRFTFEAMNRLKKDIDKRVVVKILDTLQGARYLSIAKRDPSQEIFIRGWLNRRCR
jgi:lysozyme family protein